MTVADANRFPLHLTCRRMKGQQDLNMQQNQRPAVQQTLPSVHWGVFLSVHWGEFPSMFWGVFSSVHWGVFPSVHALGCVPECALGCVPEC